MSNCKFCGQEFSTSGFTASHERTCDENPEWAEEEKLHRLSMKRFGILPKEPLKEEKTE